jgi:leader peptidase (prepilin peptidase)/N-methyltransferase
MGMPGVVDAALLGLLGLLVGSFLNVVIHRMPKMMDLRWAAECAEFQAASEKPDLPPIELAQPTFNLMVPR